MIYCSAAAQLIERSKDKAVRLNCILEFGHVKAEAFLQYICAQSLPQRLATLSSTYFVSPNMQYLEYLAA